MENEMIIGIVLVMGLVDLVLILCLICYAFVYLFHNLRAESQVSLDEQSTSANEQSSSLDEAVRKAFVLALNRHKQLQQHSPDNVTTDNKNEDRRSDTETLDREPSKDNIRDDRGNMNENRDDSEMGNDSGAVFNFGECDVAQFSNRISKSYQFAAADDSGHRSDCDDDINDLLDEGISEYSEDYESNAEGEGCEDF